MDLKAMLEAVVETQEAGVRKRLRAALYLGARMALEAVGARGSAYSSTVSDAKAELKALSGEPPGDAAEPVVPESDPEIIEDDIPL
jgi:hypothetical protein